MTLRAPVRKSDFPLMGFEEVEDTLPVNLWDYASNDAWWVYINAVIAIPQYSSPLHFIANLQTSEGYVPITIYISIYDSG